MKLLTMIRIYRAFRGYSLKYLAEEIGITPRELSAMEAGKDPSGQTMICVMLWALGKEKTDARNSSETAAT